MRQEIEQAFANVCNELFNTVLEVELTRPNEQFGDYSTNVALQLSKKLGKSPRELAEQITSNLQNQLLNIKEINVAGSGFINMRLTDDALLSLVNAIPNQSLAGKTVVTEYSDPNPFKVMHAGHLYTSVVGDAVSKLLETAGAKVYRVNFGGDVGLHVAKTMWAILQEIGGENPEKLNKITEKAEWLSDCYVTGTAKYDSDNIAKNEIISINKRVYKIFDDGDKDSPFAQIYWECRSWSYDYFNEFYKRIGSHFDKYYPESETAKFGLQKAKELLEQGVLEKSNGAVVFKGENHGLHTRVFINSEGLPTYESKDLGLTIAKIDDFHPDKMVIITGNDIVEYMKVVLKVLEHFDPVHAQATKHLTHGMVRLAGGTKMSSRKGNILKAVDVIDAAQMANETATGQKSESTALAAVKYAFLKNRIGGDIVYDPAESVALEGNSGPYLQYAHARARSILNKTQSTDSRQTTIGSFEKDERSLLRKIGEYAETVDKSVQELTPHHICTYLYELAQEFNRFYEHNRVIDDPRQSVRLFLTKSYADTLKNGLELLNILAPNRM